MGRLGGCWDTADGIDKERDEEGNDGFLDEAKGKHDLENLEKKKQFSRTFCFFFLVRGEARYICTNEAMGLEKETGDGE